MGGIRLIANRVFVLIAAILIMSILLSASTRAQPSAPIVTVSPSSWAMDVGQSKTFTANPSGGSGIYNSYQWYVGGSAQSGQTNVTFNYAPSSAGSFSITATVTDSLGMTSVQSSASSVSVNSNPTVSVQPSSPAMDLGQSKTFTAVSGGGAPPYTYAWSVDYVAQPGTNNTFSYTPSTLGSHRVSVTMMDSVFGVVGSYANVAVNSALIAPSLTPTPGTVTQGDTSSITSTTVSTGSSPYSYTWFNQAPGATSYSTITGATSSSYSFATTTSTTVGTWYFILQVTDTASSAINTTSTSVIVNAAPSTPTPTPAPTVAPTTPPTSKPTATPTPTKSPTPTPTQEPTPTISSTTNATFSDSGTAHVAQENTGFSIDINGTAGTAVTVKVNIYDSNPEPAASLPQGVILAHYSTVTFTVDPSNFHQAQVTIHYSSSDVTGLAAPYAVYKYMPDTSSYVKLNSTNDASAQTLTVTLDSPTDPLLAIGNAYSQSGTESPPSGPTEGGIGGSALLIIVVAVVVIVVVVGLALVMFRRKRGTDQS